MQHVIPVIQKWYLGQATKKMIKGINQKTKRKKKNIEKRKRKERTIAASRELISYGPYPHKARYTNQGVKVLSQVSQDQDRKLHAIILQQTWPLATSDTGKHFTLLVINSSRWMMLNMYLKCPYLVFLCYQTVKSSNYSIISLVLYPVQNFGFHQQQNSSGLWFLQRCIH